ncbi:MAG: hypothetical protein HY532_01040, partial [Chloroflexi bacterium]|nr:hypothetical protein [Chloroflexota bacterium]
MVNTQQGQLPSEDAGQALFTVALDVMGGDYGPSEVVPGAVQAARDLGVRVLLVGDEGPVSQALSRYA